MEIQTSDGKVITLDEKENILTMPDGKRFVLENDLLAVKKSLGKQVEDMQEASRLAIQAEKEKADKHYQDLLTERTAKEQLESQVKELEPFKTKTTELETQVKEATDSRGQLQDKMLGLKKDYIKTIYKIQDESTLEGKTMEQLDTLEEALKLVGPRGGSKNFDGGGGEGGSSSTQPFKAELDEIAEAKEKAGVRQE